MKSGDMVTILTTLPLSRSSYFNLWNEYEPSKKSIVLDIFYVGEAGLVLEKAVTRVGRENARVLSPRGISGWITTTSLEVVT